MTVTALKRMGEAKITRGGQVTLTKFVRQEMDVRVGDYVIFLKDGDKIVIVPAEIAPKNPSKHHGQ